MSFSPVIAKPAPTVLSTDIGSDVDDTWALAQLLRSPELDLKMVLTETGEARYRGAVTAKVLEIAERTDVGIALGSSSWQMSEEKKFQGPWVEEGYDLDGYAGTVHEDGVQAFIDFVSASEETVTVIGIGPAPSLAKALMVAPEIAKKCKFYGMFGSFRIGYDGKAPISNETNVRVDVPAFRVLMKADWQHMKITPLDTCGILTLSGENYHRIWSATNDPLMRAVIENYCIWAPRVDWGDYSYFATRSSVLFDSVAVHMASSSDFLKFEDLRFDVTDDGFTKLNPKGEYKARVAMEWTDLEGFEAYLTRRLLGEE
ncbi:MAG: nucleoside hydrolase [Verrucomicrobiota bacterium]